MVSGVCVAGGLSIHVLLDPAASSRDGIGTHNVSQASQAETPSVSNSPELPASTPPTPTPTPQASSETFTETAEVPESSEASEIASTQGQPFPFSSGSLLLGILALGCVAGSLGLARHIIRQLASPLPSVKVSKISTRGQNRNSNSGRKTSQPQTLTTKPSAVKSERAGALTTPFPHTQWTIPPSFAPEPMTIDTYSTPVPGSYKPVIPETPVTPSPIVQRNPSPPNPAPSPVVNLTPEPLPSRATRKSRKKRVIPPAKDDRKSSQIVVTTSTQQIAPENVDLADLLDIRKRRSASSWKS